jgi:hypothetical protein
MDGTTDPAFEGPSLRRGSRHDRWRVGWHYLGEAVLVAAMFVLYRVTRQLTNDDLVTAFRNARHIITLEQRLRINIEEWMQRALINTDWLVRLLNRYYVWMHFPVAIGSLAGMLWRRRSAYATCRNEMAAVTLAALVLHIAIPLAPPRLMPGYVDTLMASGPRIYPASAIAGASNQIAAMPSLHFGWALLTALWFCRSSVRRVRHLVLLHPVVMLFAIVATANHWVLDAVVAAAIVTPVHLIVGRGTQALRSLA